MSTLPARAHPAASLRWADALFSPWHFLQELPPAAPPLLANAWALCHAWMRGDSHFPLLTSGSTGAPKAIELTRRQMEASARATAAALGLQPGQRSLICLPTGYIAGRMMLVRGLVLGLQSTLVEPAADPLAALDRDAFFDLAAFVPLQLQTLLDGPPDRRARLDAMHAILVGGAPLEPALDAALRTLNAPVYHTYGMTETATHIALRRLNGAQPDAAFTPLPGVETRLDTRGCLQLRGPMTDNQWIQTNDLVELGEDGRFVWLGRVDLVVNSGGVKIAVEPLEAELAALLPALAGEGWGSRRFFLAGLPDARLGQVLALVLEGAPLLLAAEAALLEALRARFGPFRAPRRILTLPRFLLTPTGKIERAATLAALAPPQA